MTTPGEKITACALEVLGYAEESGQYALEGSEAAADMALELAEKASRQMRRLEQEAAVAWLRQQIDEDRAAAKVALATDWRSADLWVLDGGVRLARAESARTAAHIARHDPRSVAADCEAKLAILELCDGPASLHCNGAPGLPDEVAAGEVLKRLACGYKYRDGYEGHWGH